MLRAIHDSGLCSLLLFWMLLYLLYKLFQYIDETEELALKGLKDNRHILDMIVQELLKNSRITGLVSRRN